MTPAEGDLLIDEVRAMETAMRACLGTLGGIQYVLASPDHHQFSSEQIHGMVQLAKETLLPFMPASHENTHDRG